MTLPMEDIKRLSCAQKHGGLTIKGAKGGKGDKAPKEEWKPEEYSCVVAEGCDQECEVQDCQTGEMCLTTYCRNKCTDELCCK